MDFKFPPPPLLPSVVPSERGTYNYPLLPSPYNATARMPIEEPIIELSSDGSFDISSPPEAVPPQPPHPPNAAKAKAKPPPTPTPTTAAPAARALTPCDAFKEQGNDCFAKGDYDNAMLHYTSAINAATSSLLDVLSSSKLYTNRALCALRQSIHPSPPPTIFSVRDLAVANNRPSSTDLASNKPHLEKRRLLQQCVADCSKAQQLLQSTTFSSTSSAPVQLSKAVLRMSQAQALLGDIDASSDSAKTAVRHLDAINNQSVSSSADFSSQRTQTNTWYDSLKQLEKDKAAVISSLSAADHVLSRDKGSSSSSSSPPLDRVVLAAASACAASSGSLPAVAGVAATVAHNLLVSSLVPPSSDDGASVRGLLASMTEAVAKAVHKHGGAPNFAAQAVFDALVNQPLLPNLLQPRSEDAISAALSSVAYQGAGIAAATAAGLLGKALPEMGIAARDAVLMCGGNAAAAARVAKSISGKGGDDDNDDDEEDEDEDEDEDVSPPVHQQHPNASFIPSTTYVGSKENHVFRLGSKGLGYYEDLGYWGQDTTTTSGEKTSKKVNKKKEKKRILDPAHPAFAGMTPDQIDWLESMLKLSDKEIMGLPPDQRDIVCQFRDIWKENPDAFKKRPEPEKKDEDAKSDFQKQKQKEKDALTDPLKWLKAHSESLDWFKKTHGDFDREAFLTVEKENARKHKEEGDKLDLERQARTKQEADALMSDLGIGVAQKKLSGVKISGSGGGGGVVNTVKTTKKEKEADAADKRKKKNSDKDEKKKDLQDLLKWSSGGA